MSIDSISSSAGVVEVSNSREKLQGEVRTKVAEYLQLCKVKDAKLGEDGLQLTGRWDQVAQSDALIGGWVSPFVEEVNRQLNETQGRSESDTMTNEVMEELEKLLEATDRAKAEEQRQRMGDMLRIPFAIHDQDRKFIFDEASILVNRLSNGYGGDAEPDARRNVIEANTEFTSKADSDRSELEGKLTEAIVMVDDYANSIK